MTISIVQDIAFNGAWSGSFGSDVGAGNTVFLFGFQYNNPTMSSSNPEFDGSSVSAASQLFGGMSGNPYVYATIWMLPDLAGGAASVALTHTGGTVDGNVGMVAIEVSGLGAAPSLDAGATPNPETGTSSTGPVTSGSTGDITAAPELILAAAIGYGQAAGTPSPWTCLKADPSNNTVAAWQVVTSPGGAYDFTGNTVSTSWFAGVAAVKGAGGTPHTATAALTVSPGFTSAKNPGVRPALTVTPSFSAARVRGKYRSGLLEVIPAFTSARQVAHARAAALAVHPRFTETHTGGQPPGSGACDQHHHRRRWPW